MTQTSLPDGPRLPQPYIHGYDLTEDPPEDVSTVAAMSYVWATGGISSTPDDLTGFIRADLGRKLFGQATQDQQLQLVNGQSEPIGPGVNQAGLGIFAYATRCGTVYGHTGNWFGYTQFAAASLDGSRSVTVSVNERLHPTLPTKAERLAFAALRRTEETAVCAALS